MLIIKEENEVVQNIPVVAPVLSRIDLEASTIICKVSDNSIGQGELSQIIEEEKEDSLLGLERNRTLTNESSDHGSYKKQKTQDSFTSFRRQNSIQSRGSYKSDGMGSNDSFLSAI